MTEKTGKEPGEVQEELPRPTERGAGFLLWGLIFVTVLNLGMIIGALAWFAP